MSASPGDRTYIRLPGTTTRGFGEGREAQPPGPAKAGLKKRVGGGDMGRRSLSDDAVRGGASTPSMPSAASAFPEGLWDTETVAEVLGVPVRFVWRLRAERRLD